MPIYRMSRSFLASVSIGNRRLPNFPNGIRAKPLSQIRIPFVSLVPLASSMEFPEPLHPLPSRCATNSCQKSRLVGGTDWKIAIKGQLGSTHQKRGGGTRKRWVAPIGWGLPGLSGGIARSKKVGGTDWAIALNDRSQKVVRKRWLAPIGWGLPSLSGGIVRSKRWVAPIGLDPSNRGQSQ